MIRRSGYNIIFGDLGDLGDSFLIHSYNILFCQCQQEIDFLLTSDMKFCKPLPLPCLTRDVAITTVCLVAALNHIECDPLACRLNVNPCSLRNASIVLMFMILGTL
jgi:hypothetical protein